MDWACCGEIEEDERSALPATLNESIMAAMQEPHVMLDVSLRCEPWARRDALRRNCVRLLARRELLVERKLVHDDSAPDARLPAPHSAALISHTLLEAIGRGKVDAMLARMPKLVADGDFNGSPRDILHTLRCPSMPSSRACAMLRCVCVSTRPHGELEFEIDYCARTSSLRLRDEFSFRKLAACFATTRPKLAKFLVDGFDEKIAPRLGRLVARILTRTHSDLARKGFFSADIVAALRLDVDRVWREEEPRIAALLDPPKLRKTTDVLYSIDATWIQIWRDWIRWHPARTDLPIPPGPVVPAPPDQGVLVSASLWAYFEAVHGKKLGVRPEPCRRRRPVSKKAQTTPNVLSSSLPARPVALKILQRAWRRSLVGKRKGSKRENSPVVVLVPFGECAEKGRDAAHTTTGCHPSQSYLGNDDADKEDRSDGDLELVERGAMVSPLDAAAIFQ